MSRRTLPDDGERRSVAGFDQVVTVDGPSGSGKTSLLLALRQRYDCLAVEAGPIVRTVAWWAERHRLSVADAVVELARRDGCGQILFVAPGSSQLAASELEVAGLPMRQRVFSGSLGPAITATSVDPMAVLWVEQLVRGELHGRAAAVSGRQAASRLVPDAALQLQLTADRSVRTDRKARQLAAAGLRPIWHDDARLLPDLQADQVLVDTTRMTVAEVAEVVSGLIDRRLRWRRSAAIVPSGGAVLPAPPPHLARPASAIARPSLSPAARPRSLPLRHQAKVP